MASQIFSRFGYAERILLCGFLALTISFGVRTTFGFFLAPLSLEFGWSLGALSLALAVQNLVWGAAQPFTGGLADTKGPAIVVGGGATLYAVGVAAMAVTQSETVFFVAAGLVVGVAQACLGFPIVLGALGRTASDARRSLYLGIATSGGSFGQLLFAPIGVGLLSALGRVDALLTLAAICLICVALALGLRRGRQPSPQAAPAGAVAASPSLRATLRVAARHPGFLLLTAGFFVCGFQLGFVTFHLPAFAALCGLASNAAAIGLALIGGFNILGTIAAGQLGGMMRPKFPLSAIYAGRGLASLAMVTFTVTEPLLYGFSIVMGFLWLSTVPLTSGVVGRIFGPKYVGVLFGVVFFSHQVGSFLGVWMAGYLYDTYGSYDAIWWLSAALGLFAAVVNLPIDDRRIVIEPAAAPA
jgi:MFS family permease